VLLGIHDDHVGGFDRRCIECRQQSEFQAPVLAAIARGVRGTDQMVQHDRCPREEQPSEVNVEVPHVPHKHDVGGTHPQPFSCETEPGAGKFEREGRQAPCAAEHRNARGGVEPQRHVALDELVPAL
jgi:hypothetical protein